MHPVLDVDTMLVKEQVGMFKASNNYDIYDAGTGELIMECREPKLGLLTKIFRFTDYKRMTPFNVEVRTPEGELVVRVSRGMTVFVSKVDVFDNEEERIGGFKQKWFSIGGSFKVLGPEDKELCALKGKWTSWDFNFEKDGKVLATVSKEWAGLGKELFTSADNYVLNISQIVPKGHKIRALILGAVVCIDMVLKE